MIGFTTISEMSLKQPRTDARRECVLECLEVLACLDRDSAHAFSKGPNTINTLDVMGHLVLAPYSSLHLFFYNHLKWKPRSQL